MVFYHMDTEEVSDRFVAPCFVNGLEACDGEIDDMLRIRLHEAKSDEDIFTSVAWIRAFNIIEPIYVELCHEFYSTYEFDEVCADDELKTKKIIKFRLGGRAHSLTLLEFARRLGLYQAVKLEEEGFNVYFEGGLCNDEHFNAQDYWLSISREESLGLSRSHTSTIMNLILRLIHKMITYGLCQRMTRVLTEDVVRSLSALIYCRDLDTITLRDLIDSDGFSRGKVPFYLRRMDTANSGKKKEMKGMVFYQMETEEVRDRFVAPCFVNGLKAYDGEINLGVEENTISNKSFLRMTKAVTDFEVGTITIHPDIDPFLKETKGEEKSNDDWDHLLDFNIDDVPLLGKEGHLPFVCKIGKSSHNKKRAMENLNFFYQDVGTSSSAEGHLT
nr:hypothetical protein [Tanacetum cinerariifolium]